MKRPKLTPEQKIVAIRAKIVRGMKFATFKTPQSVTYALKHINAKVKQVLKN